MHGSTTPKKNDFFLHARPSCVVSPACNRHPAMGYIASMFLCYPFESHLIFTNMHINENMFLLQMVPSKGCEERILFNDLSNAINLNDTGKLMFKSTFFSTMQLHICLFFLNSYMPLF
jgi:hypothetical protein